MSAPIVIKVIAENVTEEARVLAPGNGRRRPVEIEEPELRRWLENFAALPALDAEEAEARLHLDVSARRLVVRWTGGRLGVDERDAFVAATVDEIVARLRAETPRTDAGPAEAMADATPQSRSRVQAQVWLLAGLLAVFAAVCWWMLAPEKPEGVEWIGDAAERQTILTQADGKYASDNERLSLDGAAAQLTATNTEGVETLHTTVRVGRRAGTTVLVTEGGAILEIAASGQIRIDSTDYRRVP